MSVLAGLIALSRLVHPTSTGDRYCARIFKYGDPNSIIEAVRFFGVSPDISLIDGRSDWLSAADGQTLLETRALAYGKDASPRSSCVLES